MSFKLLVLYPPPSDAAEFERAYTEDHAPMVTSESFPGITKFVQLKVVGTPDGSPPAYTRIAELHFDSIGELQTAAGGESAAATVAHANKISTGGAPLILVCQETTKSF